jgi:hypothetical protein
MPTEEELKNKTKNEGAGDKDEEEEKDIGEKMDVDFDVGNEFKD